ncbi:phospholipase A [Polaromonas sp. SM01]|uniref:phospholipase A n=1 Tax=Polaromonas sp. SM01 TaxID=3085630 RepID=UPI0029817AEF|nr:phospholipase A [Polaromonas sp. SM01]MDW5444635.1 phospholipase A [Polaromonas sp. SM01]
MVSLTATAVQKISALLGLSLLAAGLAQAQTGTNVAQPERNPLGWQACQAMGSDATAQLACFKNWAASQPPTASTSTAASASQQPDTATALPAVQVVQVQAPDGKKIGCRDTKYSELARFWELQKGSDCDTFGLRGYRPISMMWIGSDGVNNQPSSPSPGHTVSTPFHYERNETRLQLSVRTKVAKGLLTSATEDDAASDSLWVGYTQQSSWQLFNGTVSRPFRTTDHEPEVVYIYPHMIDLPGGWKYRLSGLALNHQSNGQSLPQSRSWNRVYLMGAAEKELGGDARLTVQGRIWHRLRESAQNDDNPGITDYIGRAELAGAWQVNKRHTLGMTVRHSLKSEARGSVKLEWMKASTAIADSAALRYHVQLFSGYGDSLVDYNRRRTVLGIGLSLVDW